MKSAERTIRSKRLCDLPVYLFEDLASTRRQKEAAGIDVIDLAIGDPDLGAPDDVVRALREYAGDKRLHCYTPDWAIGTFNAAVAGWMAERFGVDLDPSREILPLVGTKEGIAHLPLAILNPGDAALVPDPGYPVYSRGVWFAGGEVEWIPLMERTGFIPDIESLDLSGRRLVYLNYPNNPTSAVAGADFYRRVVDMARKAGALVVNDAAYSEITFDGYASASVLQAPRARDVAVEFHSFSKTFSMPGWRVGFAAGHAGIITALRSLKSNIDSGVFGAVLLAAGRAIRDSWPAHGAAMKEYHSRRSMIIECLDAAGIEYHRAPATLYVWAKVPGPQTSLDFARSLLEEAGVLVAPGSGFGRYGEGYFRISITCPRERIRIAAERLREVSKLWKT